jgi:hypothetical protein
MQELVPAQARETVGRCARQLDRNSVRPQDFSRTPRVAHQLDSVARFLQKIVSETEPTGGNMRKQDRIANQQQQGRSQDTNRNQSQPLERERMKGSDSERMRGSESETQRPPRQSGKLPLPD